MPSFAFESLGPVQQVGGWLLPAMAGRIVDAASHRPLKGYLVETALERAFPFQARASLEIS